MKKTLLTTTLLVAAIASTTMANAFEWKYMNPANWGTCPRCEKVCTKDPCTCKTRCKCKKEKCNPCQKVVKPCNPCQTKAPEHCDACDKLQETTAK